MLTVIITNINMISLQVQGDPYGNPDKTYLGSEQDWKKQETLRTIQGTELRKPDDHLAMGMWVGRGGSIDEPGQRDAEELCSNKEGRQDQRLG